MQKSRFWNVKSKLRFFYGIIFTKSEWFYVVESVEVVAWLRTAAQWRLCRYCDIGKGGWGFCIGSMRWLVRSCWFRLMCSDDRKAAVQSKIRYFLVSLSVVLSWRVVRSGCCNVLQMGGSPVLFRCAKIGIFGEYGVAGRGKYGCGGGGDVGFRGSRGSRCSRGNPF